MSSSWDLSQPWLPWYCRSHRSCTCDTANEMVLIPSCRNHDTGYPGPRKQEKKILYFMDFFFSIFLRVYCVDVIDDVFHFFPEGKSPLIFVTNLIHEVSLCVKSSQAKQRKDCRKMKYNCYTWQRFLYSSGSTSEAIKASSIPKYTYMEKKIQIKNVCRSQIKVPSDSLLDNVSNRFSLNTPEKT